MDFVPNCEEARKYNRKEMQEENQTNGIFETYSPAYVVTNEKLRELPQLLPRNHKKVLTVVGSGDHPFWFSLYGAKHIDTFDTSYNAKIIMDIKIAALNCLSWSNYKRFVDDLYEINFYPFRRISEMKNMCKILPKLPKIESEYIKSLGTTKIFRTFCKPQKSKVLPTFWEYIKLRHIIKEPYNFYMTDIRNLGDFLTTSYDVIHLSNILDYVPVAEQANVIFPLLNHVNPGGRIIAHNMQYDIDTGYDNYFGDIAIEIADSLADWRYIQKPIDEPKSNIILLNGTHILERVG